MNNQEQELVAHVTDKNALIDWVLRHEVHNAEGLLLHRETMQMVYPSGQFEKFWMQKRAENKKQYGGHWTLAVTCHVNKEDVSEIDPLGYLTAGEREAEEEIHVRVKKQKLIRVVKIETPKNKAMAGLVVAEAEDMPTPDPLEVSEIKLFDRESIMEIVGMLTPGALICLTELGIIKNS